MSQATPHDDLDALRRSESKPAGRARRSARWTMLFLFLGVIATLAVILPPILFPPRQVRLAQVRVAGDVTVRSQGGVEAAGWIEADPFPVAVRPLVPGVVKGLEVLEGQRVEKDKTVIATLENVDLENALAVAQSIHALRKSEVEEIRARLTTAVELFEQKLDLRHTLAQWHGEQLVLTSAVAKAEQAVHREEAALETAKLDLEALAALEAGGSVTPLALRRAKARIAEAQSSLRTARAEVAHAQARVRRVESLVAIAKEGLEDPWALRGTVRELKSAVARADASRDLARTELEVAQRNVDLLTIRAPIDGVVLRLETAPGSTVGPKGDPRGGAEEVTGSTGRLGGASGSLVQLYDPGRLQARVDVLLSDVGGIGAGTEVEIEVEALPSRTFQGEVTRLQHEADLLKNTLQVKVRILDPDPLLRPEMLARARFSVRVEEAGETAELRRMVVPREAVRDGKVWRYDPRDGGRAYVTAVQVVAEQNGDAVIEGPLGPGHKVILDPVEDGERVKEISWVR